MKLGPPFTPSTDASPAGFRGTASGLGPRPAQRQGVALVVTLILLALITTMAIAFIALTHRETAAVAALGSTTDAELAAEAALERAKAEILTAFIVKNQGNNLGAEVLGPELFVSVNGDTNRLTSQGMYVNPSAPVFVNTNTPGLNGPFDDRFFLDLNRNRMFEETGFLNEEPGVTNWLVGDPQWIGLLNNPLRYHTNNNRFISRYAYLVQPIGRGLDLNNIHNAALHDASLNQFGYTRNQGVGPFELNLGAFFADLNTNAWNNTLTAGAYVYNPIDNRPAAGDAFLDSYRFLQFRFDPNWPPAANPTFVPRNGALTLFDFFNNNAQAADWFGLDGIDAYADGLNGNPYEDQVLNLWSGSPGRKQFHTLHDIFHPNKSLWFDPFINRLAAASQRNNFYDRYTYYRMLSQMGTDSAPEDDSDKINLNYVNVRSWKYPGFRYKATDMVSWTNATTAFVGDMGRTGPELFFLSVARKLFMQDTNLMAYVTTNANTLIDAPLRIPVFTNNSRLFVQNNGGILETNPLYTARIHQILQQAANIYDATRGSTIGEAWPYYPTIFRPRFERDGNDVFIVDYIVLDQSEHLGVMGFGQGSRWIDLERDTVDSLRPNDNIYNIPLIIGARQGYPNFNEFSSRSTVQAVRRIFAQKDAGETDRKRFRYREEFSLTVSNQFGFEVWNSYFSNAYPRQLSLFYSNRVIIDVRRSSNLVASIVVGTNFFPNTYAPRAIGSNMFIAPPAVSQIVFSLTNNAPVDGGGATNDFAITVRNQIRYFLFDGDARGQRHWLVDAVALSATNEFFDIGFGLSYVPGARPEDSEFTGDSQMLRQLWSREKSSNPWYQGVESQLNISRDPNATPTTEWANYGAFVPSKDAGIASYLAFEATNIAMEVQVPFVAVRSLIQSNSWRANDPLVHYTLEDLARPTASGRPVKRIPPFQIGQQNPDYSPWPETQNAYRDARVRDPGVRTSDLWDFPTNRFPTVGWLGRVHRGTPWQTIYLKSDPAPLNMFWGHSGPRRSSSAANSIRPHRDWELLDIFTGSLHPHLTKGRLSINQTNLAAWSAVFSGLELPVAKVEDDGGGPHWYTTNIVVQPSAVDGIVGNLLAAINTARTNQGREFTKMSQFMRARELTLNSPVLRMDNFDTGQGGPSGWDDVYDSDYEAIPERILGLIKLGEPRFVVYSWGQSLKPAERNPENSGPSVVTSGDERGLVRNYQITGELATKAVVRIEFERLSNNPSDPLYDQFDYRKPRAVIESFNLIPPD